MISERGSDVYFYATFVDRESEAASISGTPVITVVHRQGASNVTDVSSQDMVQLTGTTYYFKWTPSVRAFMGNYVARYNVWYNDGSNVIGAEDFQIVIRGAYSKVVGGLVSPGGGKTVIRDIWSESEKDDVMKKLDVLAENISKISEVNQILEERGRVLGDIKQKIDIDSEKRVDDIRKFDSIIEMLTKSYGDDKKFVAQKILGEMNELRRSLAEMKEINDNLRIPLIITELEEIKQGLEHMQEDLVKTLPTTALEKAVVKK